MLISTKRLLSCVVCKERKPQKKIPGGGRFPERRLGNEINAEYRKSHR